MRRSAHAKEVLDDSWITEDTTSLHQHKLLQYLSYLSHSESEQYKLRDSRSLSSGLGRYASKVV